MKRFLIAFAFLLLNIQCSSQSTSQWTSSGGTSSQGSTSQWTSSGGTSSQGSTSQWTSSGGTSSQGTTQGSTSQWTSSGGVSSPSVITSQWQEVSLIEDTITIYGTSAYREAYGNLNQVQTAIANVMQFYQKEIIQQQNSWGLPVSMTAQQIKQSQAMFSQYLQAITGQTSYTSVLQQIFQGYAQLPQIYQNKLSIADQQPNPNASVYFAQKPFQNGSFALDVVREAIGNTITYITNRMKLITIDNCESLSSQAFLIGSTASHSQFWQLQYSIDTLKQVCINNFSLLQNVSGISAQQLKVLENNYTSIFTEYETYTCNMMVAFTLKLLNQLSNKYPIDFALHSNVSTMKDNLVVPKELYALAMSSLDVLKQNEKQSLTVQSGQAGTGTQKQQTYFGIYSSLQDVAQGLGMMMGNLLSYAAIVEQNKIKQQIEVNKSLPSDISLMQKNISKASLLYLQAAGCYYNANDMAAYNAAVGIGKYLSLTAQTWLQGQTYYQSGSYGYAAEQFQFAYQAAQQAGWVELSFLLLRFYNEAMLKYAQYMINQYVNFPQYQKDVAEYVQAAATIPQGLQDFQEGTIQNLFYSPNSQALDGIAGLCGQIVGNYKESLSSLQLTQQSTGSDKVLLQNAVTVTQNIADAAQAMLIGNSAADTNIYQYAFDPEKVFLGQQQYFDIFHSFKSADVALSAQPNNQYAPFGILFSQSSVKTFYKFAQIHFARICLMSALKAGSNGTDASFVSLFLSLVSACKVYRTLGDLNLANYCVSTLEKYEQYFQIIIDDAQQRVNNPQATQLDYQIALAEMQGICWWSGDESMFQFYQQIVQYYTEKMNKGAFDISFPSLTQAYTYYQAYLLALYKEDQAQANRFQQNIKEALTELVLQIDKAQNFVTNPSNNFNECIAVQEQLKDLQKKLEQYSIAQYYDKALFGIQGNDFCTILNSRITKKYPIPLIEFNFITKVKKILNNPVYQLANLYMTECDKEFQNLNNNFNSASPTYGLLTNSLFKELIKNYKIALTSFAQLGLQDKVIQVEQAMTQVAALRYFSAVIPSDQVKKIILSANAIVNNNTQAFQTGSISSATSSQTSQTSNWATSGGTSFSEPSTSDWTSSGGTSSSESSTSQWTTTGGIGATQSGQQTASTAATQVTKVPKPSILPYYLMADWELNISQLVENANNVAQQASQLAAEGTSIPSIMTQKQETYSQILSSAQQLIGKEESINEIIKNVVVPLFQDDLQNGGFQGVFRTLDEEVALYAQQITYLVNNGMQVGGNLLKATLKLTLQENPATGQSDILIQGTNMPLAPIPRYRGDMNCALYYYKMYQKFFNQNGQPVTISGQVFFPITGSKAQLSGEKGQRAIDRAYLASALQYKQKIAYLMAPLLQLTAQDRFKADFQTYAKQYNQLTKAYEWQIALISAIGTLQTQAGLGYVDVNKENSDLYKNWAEDCTNFLFGAPFAPSYLKVLNDAQGYYDLAAQSSENPADQSALYTQAAQLNINAAQTCETMVQMLPQVDGYPSPQPSGFPSGSTTAGTETFGTLQCGAAPTYSFPSTQAIVWKYYKDAQMHYQEALKLYQQALAAATSQAPTNGNLSNDMIRWLTGKSLMCYARAALQRIALFARNAWTVTTEEKDNVESNSVSFNSMFQTIRINGASGGASAALAGEQSLLYGTGQQSSGDSVSQYELMKKLILDANIYMMGLVGATEALTQALPSLSADQINTDVPTVTGGALICAAANNMPNLGALLPSTHKVKGYTGQAQVNIMLYSGNLSMVNLNELLTSTSKMTLPCSDTFPSFVEYAINNLIGNSENKFETLNNNINVAALNSLFSQLSTIFSNLYKQTFLHELMKDQNGAASIEKAQTSFITAIKAAQESMLVNATGYLG